MNITEVGINTAKESGVLAPRNFPLASYQQIYIERPFLALIVDNKKHSVLMAAKIEDPVTTGHNLERELHEISDKLQQCLLADTELENQ